MEAGTWRACPKRRCRADFLVVAAWTLGSDRQLWPGARIGPGGQPGSAPGSGSGSRRHARQRLAQVFSRWRFAAEEPGLLPQALRSLRTSGLDIDVLMGLAILGAIGLGDGTRRQTVAFLFGLSEALEARWA